MDFDWRKYLGADLCFAALFFGECRRSRKRRTTDNRWHTCSSIAGCFLFAVKFSHGKEGGYGDGILLMILGFMEGLSAVVFTCCMALFFQSLVAVVLVVAKKADKQTEIPFVPFMFLARILYVFR